MTKSVGVLVSTALCLGLFVMAGCISSHPGSGSTAYVEIEKGDPDTIRTHAIRVFGEEGYKLTSELPGSLVFEREATRRDQVLYGGLTVHPLSMRVVVKLEPRPEGGYLVRADVFVNRDGIEDPLLKMSRAPYQSLLRRVKNEVEKAAG